MDFTKWPKAELHCHLDGSVRPATLLALAQDAQLEWGAWSVAELELTLRAGLPKESLEDYLRGFAYTIAVMQTAPALERMAYELVVDAAAESVWHLEARFCPLLGTQKSLSGEAVVEAALAGMHRGLAQTGRSAGLILCGLRNWAPETSLQIAKLAAQYKDKGVIGFDIAGPEHGFPARDHQAAFDFAHANGVNITVHAGEADGAWAVLEAVRDQHAQRVGHGTHMIEDAAVVDEIVRRRVTLEVCLQSNLETQSIPSIAAHPLRQLLARGVRVALSTDNRLMSKVLLSDELARAEQAFALTRDELRGLVRTSFQAAFLPAQDRARLWAAAEPLLI